MTAAVRPGRDRAVEAGIRKFGNGRVGDDRAVTSPVDDLTTDDGRDGGRPWAVRPAAAEDLEAVSRLRLRFLADHRGVEPESFGAAFATTTTAFVARTHAAGTLHSWLAHPTAEDGSTSTSDPVGVISLLVHDAPPRPDEDRVLDGYVINLWVDPAWRSAGLGRALVDACERGAAALGVRRLHLLATDQGRPLYESAGFTSNPKEVERHLPPPGAPPSATTPART
jgi:GNAT superfamily N-acetyltransferase